MMKKMNSALDFLREKYDVPAGTIVAAEDGKSFRLHRAGNCDVTLLPWRVERRFVELRKMICDRTLEDPSTFRFASFSAGGDLKRMLMRELDLTAFLAGGSVTGVFAVDAADAACNALVRLSGGISASIEVGVKLPVGTAPQDRHEIIARRGVASDRVVDTCVPQSSLYEWTASGTCVYTDVDAELYGLPNEEIWIVRAAFHVLTHPESAAEWNRAAEAMQEAAEAVFTSCAERKPIQLCRR